MLIELNPKLNDKLAVVVISASILESIINIGTGSTFPVHGVRDVRIVDTVFCRRRNEIWLTIVSDDIPAYVAYKKMIGKLGHKTIHYAGNRNFEYPELICVMQAECPCIEDKELNECDDDYEDKWWR